MPRSNCVYCNGANATTRDHVLARAFFPMEWHASIPIVPACNKCNNEKARLESELTSVLPFGSNHPQSASLLEERIDKLQRGNRALANRLRAGMKYQFLQSGPYNLVHGLSVPLENNSLSILAIMISQALHFHCTGSIFDPEKQKNSTFLRRFDHDNLLDKLNNLTHGGHLRVVSDTWGDNGFSYVGWIQQHEPSRSIWQITMLGGLATADERGMFEPCVWVSLGLVVNSS